MTPAMKVDSEQEFVRACANTAIQRGLGSLPTDNEFTHILQWPSYNGLVTVYQQKIDETNKILELCVQRKR
jgi:hypothetical protein